MRHRGWIGALLAGVFAAGAPAAERATVDWPSFRGPQARGIAEGRPLPATWDVEAGKNVRWKTPIPGLGHSSPVIWGDRVFLTTAISGKKDADLKVGLYGDIAPVEDDTTHSFRVLCLDRNTGKVLWERTAYEGVPKIKRHTKATHANSTAATDGKRVVAFFGSEGLHCYDMDGKLLWKKDLGLLDSGYYQVKEAQWGFGSSPIIHDDRVIVQCDVQKGSFVAALDAKDGKELWRTPREEVPTWGTPQVHASRDRVQVIANGYHEIAGYDFMTGKRLWNLRGGGDIPVPTPIVAHDLIFIMNAHGSMAPIYAIRTNASGDISLAADAETNAGIAWSRPRGASYMQTPLVYGDNLYVCRDNGALTAYEAKTGKELYQTRLGGGSTGFTASGVAGDGKLYYTSETGSVFVVRAGNTFEQLAENSLGDICMATPAIADGVLFFRTRGHLVALAEPPAKAVLTPSPGTRESP